MGPQAPPYPDAADPGDARTDLEPGGVEQGDIAQALPSPDDEAAEPTAIETFDEEGAGIAAKE